MPEKIQLRVNDQGIAVAPGTTVAAAVAVAGEKAFRKSVLGQPRGPLCGMGLCMECRLEIDGLRQCRSCQILCREGMEVRTRRQENEEGRKQLAQSCLETQKTEFEIVVVGAGPAGLAAACVAAQSRQRVALVDDWPWLGGQVWRGQPSGSLGAQGQRWITRFGQCGATLLDCTSVIASPIQGVLLAEHPRGSLEIHWSKLILATGARELFLPFPGWTLPGVIGPGGLQALAKHGWPVRAKTVVLAGSGPLLLAAADGLKRLGARIVSICEQAPAPKVARFGVQLFTRPAKLAQAAAMRVRLLGTPYRCGVWPLRAEGDEQVRCVVLTDGQESWKEQCDWLACGFGLAPNVELPLALGCQLRDGFVRVDDFQQTTVNTIFCAGEPTGIAGTDCALTEGQIAGYAASGQMAKAQALFAKRRSWHDFRHALAAAFALRPQLVDIASDDTLLCRCEDVPLGQVRFSQGWREAKLQSRCGMGACQGRICGAAAKIILGWGMESVRPPVLPARVRSLISASH